MKKQNSNLPIIVLMLAGGGLFVLLLCCTGVGVGGYFLFFAGPPVVGKWRGTHEDINGDTVVREWEFNRNGTGQFKSVTVSKFTKRESEPGFAHFEYKMVDAQTLALILKITRVGGAATDDMRREVGQSQRYKVHFDGDNLRLSKGGAMRVGLDDSINLKRM